MPDKKKENQEPMGFDYTPKIICCGQKMKIISEIDDQATFECCQCKNSFWISIKYN